MEISCFEESAAGQLLRNCLIFGQNLRLKAKSDRVAYKKCVPLNQLIRKSISTEQKLFKELWRNIYDNSYINQPDAISENPLTTLASFRWNIFFQFFSFHLEMWNTCFLWMNHPRCYRVTQGSDIMMIAYDNDQCPLFKSGGQHL